MNILLFRPKPPRETIGLQHIMLCEPLELEYIAANIDPSHQITIVDLIIESRPIEHFLKKYRPAVVGFTAYITHVNTVLDYAKRTKRLFPECKVVVGGVHAEVNPEDFSSEYVDAIVYKNPIHTFRQYLAALEKGPADVCVPGIWGHTETEPETITTFDYPPPRRDLVARYRDKYYYMFHNPCALIKTSFGCPYSCRFCFCVEITGHRFFTRDIDDVIEELQSITEPEVYIVDDNFLVSRERLEMFISRLEEKGLKKKFLIYGRADFIANNPDLIERFAHAGLRAVIVGLESNRQDDLNTYNKRSAIDINEKAVRILQKNDIDCYGTFILSPDWTKDDFKNLTVWLKKLGLIFVNLQPLTPLPGTEIYPEYEARLIIDRRHYEEWDLAHLALQPQNMSASRYYFNIIAMYFKITMSPGNSWRLIRRYGLIPCLRLSRGVMRVTFQYYGKIVSSFLKEQRGKWTKTKKTVMADKV